MRRYPLERPLPFSFSTREAVILLENRAGSYSGDSLRSGFPTTCEGQLRTNRYPRQGGALQGGAFGSGAHHLDGRQPLPFIRSCRTRVPPVAWFTNEEMVETRWGKSNLSPFCFFLIAVVRLRGNDIMARSRTVAMSVGLLGLLLLSSPSGAQEVSFIRGNANFDSGLYLSDAIFILNYIFRGTTAPACLDAADCNDDGLLNIADPIFLLSFLFSATQPPPEPHPAAGTDPTPDSLGCLGTPEEPETLRHGTLVERVYSVGGRVEHLSDHTIRITNFSYDGGGLPGVFVWLHKSRDQDDERSGHPISPDLFGTTFVNETLVYPIPVEIGEADFGYVSIFCEPRSVNYGYAHLFLGGFP